MVAAIIIIIATAVFVAVAYGNMARRIEKHDAIIKTLIGSTDFLLNKMAEYEEVVKRLAEVAKENEEYLTQAMKTEQLMQDGINAIMNYDAMSFSKGGNK